jgi:tol-pal system protein YbgF
MIGLLHRALAAVALVGALSVVAPAAAQDNSPFGLLDRMFGRSDRPVPEEASGQVSQASPTEQVLRIERLEAQIRQMTGTIEQLQFRNRQLEDQIRRMDGAPAAVPPQGAQLQRQTTQSQPMLSQPGQSGPAPASPAPIPPSMTGSRRSDLFDPSQNPNAPGAPRTLGTIASLPEEPPPVITADPSIGAPGGRGPGQPLDLSTLASRIRSESVPAPAGQPLPPPPGRNPSGTGAVAAVMPPSDTPKDQYDLGYGYILRKDYALAEGTFQAFLQRYPNDRQAPDARFWLGESLFQRGRYDAAAQAFLDLSTKHATHPKASEALLRLGQSLAALGQKEMSCATLAEVGRKYPRAPASVKQGVEREQKRVRC